MNFTFHFTLYSTLVFGFLGLIWRHEYWLDTLIKYVLIVSTFVGAAILVDTIRGVA